MADVAPPEATAALGDLRAPAAELGVALDVAQADRLARFAALLLRWNRVHNLTAIERPQQVVSHHLLDSLALAPWLSQVALEAAPDRTPRVLDVGSGGGLPGLPLAIALPHMQFTLLDKVAKKVAFVTQAIAELGLANVEPLQRRVEDHRAAVSYDIIVARALASLTDFVQWTAHLRAPLGCWLAMKGQAPHAEIEQLQRAHPELRTRTVKLRVPRLDAERHLVLIDSK
jgi:16S rRNA (guanine527-N7)-methyltransferase